MEELMNRVSGHTANAGRDMYDSSMLVDELNLLKAANEEKSTDLNTAHKLTRDGSDNNPTVSVVRKDDGSVVLRLRIPVGSAQAIR